MPLLPQLYPVVIFFSLAAYFPVAAGRTTFITLQRKCFLKACKCEQVGYSGFRCDNLYYFYVFCCFFVVVFVCLFFVCFLGGGGGIKYVCLSYYHFNAFEVALKFFQQNLVEPLVPS